MSFSLPVEKIRTIPRYLNDLTVTEITDQIENIKVGITLSPACTEFDVLSKNDPSIPTRSNKKTGAKSKKEVREEVSVGLSQFTTVI